MSIFLKANWSHIIMANYEVPTEVLIPYLPSGVQLDLYGGKAYVSLVGFMFKNTKIFNLPIPWLGTFEEVNLRFYVTRNEKVFEKRGVVFVNETIPYKAVAWVANKLYKEHYTVVPTRHNITVNEAKQHVSFEWKKNSKWNSIAVEANTQAMPMRPQSFEEFIFEHYYGYTKVDSYKTLEYKIAHPSWNVYQVTSATINCDFGAMYGKAFEFLNNVKPTAVFMAEGSAIEVAWKRNKLQLK
jgi:uncharacterized protein